MFEDSNGHIPFSDWMDSIERADIYGVIMSRLDRVAAGNFGFCQPLGSGLHELKIDHGPGYRVYFGEDGDFVVLLGGGTKATQSKDIDAAKKRWKEYNG